MTVRIHIIEKYDTYLFEEEVNAYLKEWTGKIVNYTIGRNLVHINKKWGKTTHVFRNEAMFIINEDLGKKETPPMVDSREAIRPSAIG